MILTKTQKAYLRSAAVNPGGRTVVPFRVRDQLEGLGLVHHEGLSITKITDAGRAALQENVGATVADLEQQIKDLKHDLASAEGRAKNATSNSEYWRGQYDAISDTQSPSTDVRPTDDLRKRVMRAIWDPGATEGYKGDRDLTNWQTDAVMRAIAATEGSADV